MINVTAKYKNETIYLTLEHDGKKEEISAKVLGSGSFRFSYHHPELKEIDSYQGIFISDTKFIIYPILGIGVISKDPIEIEK